MQPHCRGRERVCNSHVPPGSIFPETVETGSQVLSLTSSPAQYSTHSDSCQAYGSDPFCLRLSNGAASCLRALTGASQGPQLTGTAKVDAHINYSIHLWMGIRGDNHSVSQDCKRLQVRGSGLTSSSSCASWTHL